MCNYLIMKLCKLCLSPGKQECQVSKAPGKSLVVGPYPEWKPQARSLMPVCKAAVLEALAQPLIEDRSKVATFGSGLSGSLLAQST